MTTLMFLIFGPPIALWLVFVLLPSGRIFKAALGVFALLWIACAALVYSQPKAQPDDFLNGVELIPLWGGLFAVLIAAFARYWSDMRASAGKPPNRGLILSTLTILPPTFAIVFLGV